MIDSDKPRRRFWQIHLSTAVLIVLTASVMSWLTFGRFLAPGVAQTSDWSEADGMAIRISVQDSKITVKSPAIINIEFRNSSSSPIAVNKDGFATAFVRIFSIEGKPIECRPSMGSNFFCWRTSDFQVLRPGESVEDEYKLTLAPATFIDGNLHLWSGSGVFDIESSDILVSAEKFYPQDTLIINNIDPNIERQAELGCRIWTSTAISPKMPMTIVQPWSLRQVLSAILCVLGAVATTAFLSETIIHRRREARKP